MSRSQRQELHCHDCGKWVQFELDLELDGNHVLNCPECGHEHCRVVRNGTITGVRWDQRNGFTYRIDYATTSNSTTYAITSTSYNYFTMDAWMASGT